jgi:hypothetical protein
MNLSEFREKYPQYKEIGDAQLADALHSKFYSSIPKDQFMSAIGMAKPEAVESVGAALNTGISAIPRQLGLTARHAMTGIGGAVGVVSNPIASALNLGAIAVGQEAPFNDARTTAGNLADRIGLPKPATPTERVVGDASELMAGVGASGMAGKVAQLGGPVARKVGDFLSQGLVNQVSGAAGAGLAGGAVREAGGNAGAQFAASILGGVAGGIAPNVASGVKNWVTGPPKVTPQQIDAQVERLLANQGVDWQALPGNVRLGLRDEMSKALQIGDDVNADAVRRLADYRTVGATPTRGTLTLDPVQLTREKNLSKLAANSGQSELHGLPKIQNENNRSLIDLLNRVRGQETDAFAAGEKAVGTISARDAQFGRVEGELYRRAREAAGREIPLDREAFTRRVAEELAKENKGAFLPDKVGKLLEQIRTGKGSFGGQDFDVPFNVDVIDNIKTTLSKAQRSSADGNEKMALSIVRRVLDETQPAQGDLPSKAIQAADRARQVARARRNWWESSPSVTAATDGVEPDKFVQRFVLSDTNDAAFANVAKLAKELQRDPQAKEAVKASIVEHLKSKALSGAADEVGNFSTAGYNRALKSLDKKLPLFFNAEEVAELKALGRVASYEVAQPRGSAVNNSNTAGMMLGRGLDAIAGVSKYVPLGKAMVGDPLRSIMLSSGNRSATDVLPSLLLAPQKDRSLASLLAVPGVLSTGLLTSK